MKLKIEKLGRKLKVVLPLLLLGATVGTVGGFFGSSWGQSVFRNYSSLEAGYDQNFKIPIFKNKYQDFEQSSHGNLQIVSKPNLAAVQSLDLTTEQFIVKQQKSEVVFPIHALQSKVTQNPKTNEVTVFQASLSKAQFIDLLQNRFKPNLGLLFNGQLSAFDANLNDMVSVDYNNLITGFSFDDLVAAKTKTYPVFNYSVNDDFSNLIGTISGSLNINLNPKGVFDFAFKLSAHNLQSHTLAADATKNNFHFQFAPIEEQQFFQPILLWDINQTNNLNDWFWPIPIGPKQNEKITLPQKENSGVIAFEQYSVTNKSPSTNSDTFSFPYTEVEDFDSVATSVAKEDGIIEIKFEEEKWQRNFFNGWDDGKIPNNPGIKIQFNLHFNVMGAEYGQIQQYDTTLFGFFQFAELLNGKNYEQEITNYDLSLGRLNNFGNFKLKLNARVNLRRQLVIKISAEGHDLFYKASQEADSVAEGGFKSDFKLNHLEVSKFFDSSGQKIEIDNIKAPTLFNKNVRGNSLVAKVDANSGAEASSGGYRVGRNFWDPYLFHYDTVWSNWATEDLASYIENNPEYANWVHLQFDFAGTVETKNNTNVALKTPGSNQQIVLYSPGRSANNQSLGTVEKVYATNNIPNEQNSYKVPFSALTNDVQQFAWKEIYVFENDNKGRDWFNNVLFAWKKNSSGNYSAMRVYFYLEVKKNEEMKFQYRIGTKVSSYQWYWGKRSSAAKGIAGYLVDRLTFQIKPTN